MDHILIHERSKVLNISLWGLIWFALDIGHLKLFWCVCVFILSSPCSKKMYYTYKRIHSKFSNQ